jgi:O-antigen/teichoic acid export membrane protein
MLRTNARVLLRSTAAYSVSALVGPLFTLLLAPVYARAMPQADFGVVELVLTLAMVLSVIGSLGMATALGALMREQPDEAARQRLAATASWLAAGGCALLAAAGLAAARPLAAWWAGDAGRALEVSIYLLNLPFGAIFSVQMAALRLRQLAWRANALTVAQVLLLAFWNLLLVVVLRLNAAGALAAQALSYVLLAGLCAFVAPETFFARPLAAAVRPLLLAGAPLVPAGLAAWALAYIDRPLLVQLGIGAGEIAVYGVGNKLASMLAVASAPFSLAWTPFALALHGRPEAPRAYARALTGYVAAMLGGALALGLFAHEALLLVGTYRFLDAERYVWLLAYGPIIQGSYGLISAALLAGRRTAHLAWTSALGAAVNVALNLLLVPTLGVLGAAIATPLGYACGPLAAYAVAQRAFPVPYERGRLLLALLAHAALLAVGLPLMLREGTSAASLAARALLLALYPLALLALGVVSRAEVGLAVGWARRKMRGVLQ